MAELRRDPLLDRWIITGTAQGESLEALITIYKKVSSQECPFCVGKETETLPEIFALRQTGSRVNTPDWQVRVIPTRTQTLTLQGDLQKRGEGGIYDLENAIGSHEIVIVSPKHLTHFSQLSPEEIAEVLKVYRWRLQELAKNNLCRYALIFHNQGDGPVAVEHAHSQIVTLPFVPKTIREEINGAKRYYNFKMRCIFCDILEQEIETNKRVVLENEDCLAFTPFASRFPFEVWILPKKHGCCFVESEEETFFNLGVVLKNVLGRIEKVLANPPLNFILHTAPLRYQELDEGEIISDVYHWHLEILPHALPAGGFEWGGDFYLNPPLPEVTAKILRES
jgi:UDPglucose--hexose-1-phosphate uridylyltransferase